MSECCRITQCSISIRVRYSEVDRQNAIHHSVYAKYFEMGRTELLRINGYEYRRLEDSGVMLVVAKLECRFRSPGRYDEQLELTTCTGKTDRIRLEHIYTLTRPENNQLIAEGKTILVHIDKEGKLQGLPDFLKTAQE